MNQLRQPVFLAIATNALPTATSFLMEPVATRSKKPDSVAAEVAEKREKQLQEAAFRPVTATVTGCVVLDVHGRVIAVGLPGSVNGIPTSNMAATMLQTIDDYSRSYTSHGSFGSTFGPTIFGDNVKDGLRIMFIDSLTTPDEVRRDRFAAMCLNLPFSPPQWCDPYEMVLPTEDRSNVPRGALACRIGLNIYTTPMPQVLSVYTTVPAGVTGPSVIERLWQSAELSRQIAIQTGQVWGGLMPQPTVRQITQPQDAGNVVDAAATESLADLQRQRYQAMPTVTPAAPGHAPRVS